MQHLQLNETIASHCVGRIDCLQISLLNHVQPSQIAGQQIKHSNHRSHFVRVAKLIWQHCKQSKFYNSRTLSWSLTWCDFKLLIFTYIPFIIYIKYIYISYIYIFKYMSIFNRKFPSLCTLPWGHFIWWKQNATLINKQKHRIVNEFEIYYEWK